jgi:hypothetical protein
MAITAVAASKDAFRQNTVVPAPCVVSMAIPAVAASKVEAVAAKADTEQRIHGATAVAASGTPRYLVA